MVVEQYVRVLLEPCCRSSIHPGGCSYLHMAGHIAPCAKHHGHDIYAVLVLEQSCFRCRPAVGTIRTGGLLLLHSRWPWYQLRAQQVVFPTRSRQARAGWCVISSVCVMGYHHTALPWDCRHACWPADRYRNVEPVEC